MKRTSLGLLVFFSFRAKRERIRRDNKTRRRSHASFSKRQLEHGEAVKIMLIIGKKKKSNAPIIATKCAKERESSYGA